MEKSPLNIAFLHPDLGLGGAERLVVDAAAALAKNGHKVTVYTNHYEVNRSFAETREGLFDVRVHGDWLPINIFGMFHIIFSILRSIVLALAVAFSGNKYDVFICDQASASVAVLRVFCRNSRILFYCHYPDQLLSSRNSWIKKVYRLPVDKFEEWTTGMSHSIVVNSGFTRSVFKRTFTSLRHIDPAILYPCIDLPKRSSEQPHGSPRILLSINRYERKKNIELALLAFAQLRDIIGKQRFSGVHLVIGGGYDCRVEENVAYHKQLVQIATDLGLMGTIVRHDMGAILPSFPASANDTEKGYEPVESGAAVTFVRSFTDEQKKALLKACTAVIYTPSFEHFGIVPLEAMATCRPVIAVNSGGPLESIADGTTGFLRPPEPREFALAMSAMLEEGRAQQMGQQGYDHVKRNFSRDAFAKTLDALCRQLLQ